MQIKASIDYGMRAILYLAAKNTTCSSKDIAEDMSIPRDYLIQLAQLLRNAGLIEARPGKHGGYRLGREASEISVLDVMNALDDDARRSKRERREVRKNATMADGVRQTYDLVEESLDAYMASLTIDTLLACSQSEETSRALLAERLQEESIRLVSEG